MPTQVMLERSVEDVLVADLEANLHVPRVPALKAGRLNVELSLHHDLASIEADWRAFEANADCTVFQTFDWLFTWFCNIGVHEAGKPAIVIGLGDTPLPGCLRSRAWTASRFRRGARSRHVGGRRRRRRAASTTSQRDRHQRCARQQCSGHPRHLQGALRAGTSVRPASGEFNR